MQAPGWQAELQRLVELLPQALRAALLAREEFLEARRASYCVMYPLCVCRCLSAECDAQEERRKSGSTPLAAGVGLVGISCPNAQHGVPARRCWRW